MWISRKKFQNLEKRIADLEMAVRSQRKGTTSLEDTYENVERVSDLPWIWDKCPAGHPGIPGRVYYEEDTLPLIARLSLCGMLKAAVHDELCSVYHFLFRIIKATCSLRKRNCYTKYNRQLLQTVT